MVYSLIIFFSALSISLTAAYFSIIGLATIFPGSKLAIIVMGSVLEVGKLVAAVWLHKNWDKKIKFIKYYLLLAVLILTGITSMGIFGFLSKSHIQHSTEIQQELVLVENIDNKISRKKQLLERKRLEISQAEEKVDFSDEKNKEKIDLLLSRISSLKEESKEKVESYNSLISSKQSAIDDINKKIEDEKPQGIFASNKNYLILVDSLNKQKDIILSQISELESKSENESNVLSENISTIRSSIDQLSISPTINTTDVSGLNLEIDSIYKEIEALELEKLPLGKKLLELEAEVGPIKYIANVLQDWFMLEIDISESVRIVIITIIFVFDPLAILLLISATITWKESKTEELPPDVAKIRDSLLDQIDEYIDSGGNFESFFDRYRSQIKKEEPKPVAKKSILNVFKKSSDNENIVIG